MLPPLRLFISEFIRLVLIALCSLPAVSRGAALEVTSFHGPRPAILERYATLTSTLRNHSNQPLRLRSLRFLLASPTGKVESFTATRPRSQLPYELRPGEEHTFRHFKKMRTPGSFVYTAPAQDAAGLWKYLSSSSGLPIKIVVQVLPENSVSGVYVQVSDSHPDHVYHAGDTIRLTELPLVADSGWTSDSTKPVYPE